MIFEIKIPKPEEQHNKNPKWKIVEKIKEEYDPISDKNVQRIYYEKVFIMKANREEIGGNPVWGLSCPNKCGRYWEFIPERCFEVEIMDSDGIIRKWKRAYSDSHFIPLDPNAIEYLNFRSDYYSPSIKIFNCDVCGAMIKLVK